MIDQAIRAPRLLFLTQDAAAVRAQLQGWQPQRAEVGALRDDVSTDEISPLPVMVHFDATLGRYPYTGLRCGGETPIGRDDIRRAGIQVVVAGRRYGKGSSREHSPMAERSAGVRLVIAESFERIYRQNADNLGLFTSTDLGLVDRLQGGASIALEELLAGRDDQAVEVLRAGGWLAYTRRHLLPPPAAVAQTADPAEHAGGPRTLFDKIIDRHALGAPPQVGEGGLVKADWRFVHEYYTGMCDHLLQQAFGTDPPMHEPASIVAFEDHLSYVHRSPTHVGAGLVGGVQALSAAHRRFVARHGLRHHGYLQALQAADAGNTGSEGISHALMIERHALPGQLVVGTDSHTPHSGALGCVAFGVGSTDMAGAFVSGAVRLCRPQVMRIECHGLLPPGVAAKDLVLHLLALPTVRQGIGVGRVWEFGGSAVRALDTDERATLTNMTAELGGFTGLVEPDEETRRFLRERRGVEVVIEPWMRSDTDARYAHRIDIDAASLSPMVARPGDPGLGVPLSELAQRPRVDLAYGGSCTAGKRSDFDQYHDVLAWALGQGWRVAEGVSLFLQFGTVDVREHCRRRGYLETFERIGAELLQPACGACANCGPGSSISADQVTVSAINRNFPGRSGPGQVWLASPATVAASAIAGRLLSFAELRALGSAR